jgi:Flp pilus assembly protein TadD
MRVLETAVALAPDAPDAHNNLGIALAQSGRLLEAEREFAAALRLNPKHLNARRNLEQVSTMRR